MEIEMRIQRVFLDAGQERPLNVGTIYDLPDVIACALIATGAARHPVRSAPERKPALVPETKQRGAA